MRVEKKEGGTAEARRRRHHIAREFASGQRIKSPIIIGVKNMTWCDAVMAVLSAPGSSRRQAAATRREMTACLLAQSPSQPVKIVLLE